MLASFYFFYCADMMAEMAQATGKTADQERFAKMAVKIQQAIKGYYTDASGKFFL